MLSQEPLAIIGIGCRLPGKSDSPDSFWKMLCNGVNAVRRVPKDRWNIDTYYDSKLGTPGKSITKWGGFIDDIARFDAGFFGISPREADWMDPQQRLLLEVCARAIEDAGQDMNALRGSLTGVFTGISTTDYTGLQSSSLDQVRTDVYTATGSTISISANRISYVFDLRGPSVAMDTACSSALTALHFACRSIWRGDCKMALCAGVNALLSPAPFITFSRMGMLSPTGRCQAFDSRANGFVRGEGAGAVLLKPLSAAQADGDDIYAVIRATGANQDGRTNGITVPSPEAQEALVRETCLAAGLKTSRIDYVEAHGTGTPVGDPIEAHALGAALGRGRPTDKPLLIGSVKTNIGHLEAAAGIAGLIKLALVLKNRVVPANLHFRKPNKNIDLKALGLRVAAKREKLPSEGPLYAGINSFGFGGANAHAILESPPEQIATQPTRKPKKTPEAAKQGFAHLLCLSARSEDALKQLAGDFRSFLSKSKDEIASICRASVLRRTAHPFRLVLQGAEKKEFARGLQSFLRGEDTPGVVNGHAEAIGVDPVFVCSGQGPQWWGMGRELLANNKVFRAKIEECDRHFREFGDWSLLQELSRDEKRSRMDDTAIAQPAIFAIQVALAAVWESMGIRPAAVVGHSVGEVAAAHIAGVFTLREAARVIFYRGECMSHAGNRGRMLAAGLSAIEAETLLAGYTSRAVLGAVNGPASVTLSGDADALEEIAAVLEKRGVFNRFLQVKYAFHSHHMDPIRRELANRLGKVLVTRATLPLYSTVSGSRTEGLDFGATYWWKNVRQPVRFAEAVDALIQAGHRVFLELSAHPALTGSIQECLKKAAVTGTAVASLRRKEPEAPQVLTALSILHCAGARVDWSRHFPDTAQTAWPRLPVHPWMRDHYWHEPRTTQFGRIGPTPHPLLERSLRSAQPMWLTWLDQETIRWLPDHRVGGHIIFPGAGYIETAIAAGREQFGPDVPLRIEDFAFEKALFLPEGKDALQYQTEYSPSDQRITFSSRADQAETDVWSQHAKARLSAAPYDSPPPAVDLRALKKHCAEFTLPGSTIYENQNTKAMSFGPHFHGLKRLWRRDGEALGRLEVPAALRRDCTTAGYFFHPAFLDSTFHVQTWSLPRTDATKGPVYLPASIERLRIFGHPGEEIWCHVRCVKVEMLAIVFDFQIYDEKGRVLLDCKGFRSQATNAAPVSAPDSGDDWLYEPKWKRLALPGVQPPSDATHFMPTSFELPAQKPNQDDSRSLLALSQGLNAYIAKPEEPAWRHLLASHPGAHPELSSLRLACQGKLITQNLREQLDQNSVSRAALNRLLADAIATHLIEVPIDRVTRVLEHGGGTGGLTSYILPRLRTESTSYTFADSMPEVLSAAEKKFFGHDCFKTARIDLTANKLTGKGKYDLLIIHCTAPLTATAAKNLYHLAAPGARMLLLTPSAAPLWAQKVFLSGARPPSRAISITSLRKAGFLTPEPLAVPPAWNLSGLEIIFTRTPSSPPPRAKSLTRPDKPGTWILIGDEGGFGRHLAGTLEARGDEALLLPSAGTKAAFSQLLSSAKRQARYKPNGIVFLRPLDFANNEALDEKQLRTAETEACHAALHLVQAATERGVAGLPPIWLVTRGVAQVAKSETPTLAAAALTGLARTINSEYIQLRSCLVDLTPGGEDAVDALNLAHEITSTNGAETEVAWRGHTRYVGRLTRSVIESHGPAVSLPTEKAAYRLEITNPGVIDQLTYHECERRSPKRGEVEIAIRAAALNFRDVMKALGIYPSENPLDMLLGDECSGIITRVGPGVRRFKPGDAVIASGLGLFASHTTLPEVAVVPKPPNISFTGAVTIPVTFMTAWYALHTLGRMKRGDKVLIQAGTGGVGLAAIQLAQLAGAEVFATAGNDEKRDFLRALGVRHVADSRSVSFADEVMRATNGRGVDLVLNSLAGPAIAKGISCLAPHGRFLEIGKRDIYADSPIGLRPFRNNLSLHVIDMGQVMLDRPGAAGELLRPILKLFMQGKLHPLAYRALPASQAVNAFRIMSAARHVGKIVISMEDDQIIPKVPLREKRVCFDPKASYLITGGLGGFGLALAEWMAGCGARQIVLTGRSGAATPDAQRGVAKLESLGVKVTVISMDATSADSVSQCFARIRRQCGPLRGILHAAAVLDDGVLAHMSAERFARVMAPKVAGTWHLHQATLGSELDFFVLFSSVSALVGAAGQGNYAAANSFMDAFARYRRSLGLTALSVNWGAISDVGLAARDKKVRAHLQASGVTGITPAQAGSMLGRLIGTDAAQIGFLRVNWQTRMAMSGSKEVPPRLEELIQAAGSSEGGGAEARQAVLAAPSAQRPALVRQHVRDIVARVLRTNAAKLELERPLKEMGLDSLMAFELLHRVEQDFGISLPPGKLTAGGTITSLSHVVHDLLADSGSAGEASSETASSTSSTAASGSVSTTGPSPDSLVALRPDGTLPPLFVFHGAGGMLANYDDLVNALPATMPVYGLQSRAYFDERGEHATLEAMAHDYARLIETQQPQGAVRLAGFSAGGFFALATARELEKNGRKVAFIGLFDTAVHLLDPQASRVEFLRMHLAEMHRYLTHELAIGRPIPETELTSVTAKLAEKVHLTPSQDRVQIVLDWLAQNGDFSAEKLDALARRFLTVFSAHWDFMANLRLETTDAPLHLWQAVPPGEQEAPQPKELRSLTRSRITLASLPGHHYEIMGKPIALTLARQLNTALRRAV